ncbi:FAD/NAD(P)-binding oxidoreductase family protein [Actinidia rufa]|uniref:FAD/NAD(P)-binding oxidoreductase family protein n=1 Tax=Actinidia rufa TaxID=165716 RepID=A0A7J0H7R4_9ERIC|nr:FAD/NAD(P)-binding oxidoreductase family protein [Actinidia rufa]
MSSAFPRFILHFGVSSKPSTIPRNNVFFLFSLKKRRYTAITPFLSQKSSEELLVVVGGGAAGVYGAIRAKTIAPNLNVVVIEKGTPLSKILAEHYPRGNKELKGSFFRMHSPKDTMSWFSDHGVELKTEDDGRVFPVSNRSSSVVDCLLSEAKQRGVSLQTGKVVTTASVTADGKFHLKIEKRTIDYVEFVKADYLLVASGSVKQGYSLATQLGHSIVEPVPSLFTFKIDDPQLAELAGLGARDLFSSDYKGILYVDFIPDIHIEDVKSILIAHKNQFAKQKVLNSFPSEIGLVKRFWKYLLDREGLNGDILWASVSNNAILSVASQLKHCSFRVKGKGQFKDEFVTAGGIPLSEITLGTMESRIRSNLFFAGEVLNVDGVTGGFNFQNAWSGGYIAGMSIGNLAVTARLNEEVQCSGVGDMAEGVVVVGWLANAVVEVTRKREGVEDGNHA